MSKAVATATPEPPAKEARPPMRRLSASQAAWLLVQQPADLTEDEHAALDKLQKAIADIATAYALAQDFIRMMRERSADALADWLTRASASSIAELGSVASGLQRDLAAVTASLSLPWSNGQVEGQINRLKLIKRTMYGRASFDVLRKRILAPTYQSDRHLSREVRVNPDSVMIHTEQDPQAGVLTQSQ